MENCGFDSAFDYKIMLFMDGMSSKPPFERIKIGAPPITETFAMPLSTLVELR